GQARHQGDRTCWVAVATRSCIIAVILAKLKWSLGAKLKRIVFRTPLFGLFVAVAIAAWWSPARSYAQSSSQTAGAVHESDVAGLLTQDRLAGIQQQVSD